jgi:hypothetical protein
VRSSSARLGLDRGAELRIERVRPQALRARRPARREISIGWKVFGAGPRFAAPSGMNAQAELNKRVEELQALRDDLKVRIHLASMEAKDAWNELLPKLEKAEKLAESAVVETAKVALDDVIGSLKQLRDKIG